MLIFFASWCGPCKTEMPTLSAAINDGKADPAAVIGVDATDPDTSAAKAFVASADVRFPVGVDPDGTLTSGTFGFPGLPYTVFVNSKGVVTEIHQGITTPAELRGRGGHARLSRPLSRPRSERSARRSTARRPSRRRAPPSSPHTRRCGRARLAARRERGGREHLGDQRSGAGNTESGTTMPPRSSRTR